MTWNIRNGGWDRGGPDRLDRIIQVVTEQHPHLLALQELRGFRRTGRLRNLADALGMRAFLARACFGQPVALLVRPPVRVISVAPVRRPFHHAAARVTVETSRGPMTALSAHLHPYSGSRRLCEAAWLAAVTPPAASGRLGLLVGDLNTLDPWSDHADRIGRLPERYRSRHLRRDGSTVDTRAVALLARSGLVDLFRLAGPAAEPGTGTLADPGAGPVATGPGAGPGTTAEPGLTVPTTLGGGTEFSGMRLDYLMATPALARLARRCWVHRGGAAESASDHYPVLAELDLSY